MSGWIALVGGNEFRPSCEPMDWALLTILGRRSRVAVLPTAAKENPALAAENGIRYFDKLGAEAAGVMVTDRKEARDDRFASQLKNFDLLYFTGGDPAYLLEVMKDSPFWKAAVEFWEEGGMLAGSSAGAMVLGEMMWVPGGGWEKGLGLVPKVAVLPHYATLSVRWEMHKMRASLFKEITLVGIDEATALVGPPWKVLGIGKVTIHRAKPPLSSVFLNGEEVVF